MTVCWVRKQTKLNISRKPVESFKEKCRALCRCHEWNDIILGNTSQKTNLLVACPTIVTMIKYTLFFTCNVFLTQPRCCLTFSLHCLQMLLRCCLIHITIIIRRHNLYLVYLFFLIFSLIFIVINHITSFCIFLNNFFYYFWMITWMKKVNNLQIAKVQLQCVA